MVDRRAVTAVMRGAGWPNWPSELSISWPIQQRGAARVGALALVKRLERHAVAVKWIAHLAYTSDVDFDAVLVGGNLVPVRPQVTTDRPPLLTLQHGLSERSAYFRASRCLTMLVRRTWTTRSPPTRGRPCRCQPTLGGPRPWRCCTRPARSDPTPSHPELRSGSGDVDDVREVVFQD